VTKNRYEVSGFGDAKSEYSTQDLKLKKNKRKNEFQEKIEV